MFKLLSVVKNQSMGREHQYNHLCVVKFVTIAFLVVNEN
jgi:hypothetical protein